MLKVTRNMVLPTTITGSYPKPNWYTQGLHGRPFKVALGDSLFREQYLDAVATIINEQAMAGLDIVTDGDARFDLAVGGKSWFFYVLERLGGLSGRRDLSPGWSGDFWIRPGHILWEVQEAYQPPVVVDKVTRGPLEYTSIWKAAQRMTEKPVKFGTISAQCLVRMMWNQSYPSDKELILDLCDVMNEELRELAQAGCPLIQIEEPRHHFVALREETTDKDLQFFTEAFNREVKGVEAEIWVHTCWGNPSQQRLFWEPPSYERALPYLLELDTDVITFECASSGGKDLPLFRKYQTKKKIAIGVVSHTNTVIEPPEVVANVIRKALEDIPPERLILSTDCGFGREGLSRRIAFYKCIALVQGANLIRRELKLPEAPIRAADPRLAFGQVPGTPGAA
ncbi:MAG: cobalamin-independent methionine synthase II family protein [candidate division NC10 bacterium]|nr:cobalamin-independent methionine synthase II family protein [candidate division NC10 bacterium]